MILDSPTKILQLIASATCDVTVSGYVNDTGRPSFSEETKATASTQTICLAPGRLPKVIEHTSIKTTGGANTLTVQIYDSAGSTKTAQQIRAVLAADERLGYDADGWYVTDANGTTKVGTSGWVIAAGKIGTLSNSLTFAGTDGSTLNIGTGGTLGTSAYVTLGANVATWLATPTSANLFAAVATTTTGSGSLVGHNSPVLVTPTLGAASATSINKVALTEPATSATLTIADGKTLTASNTLTLTATDGSTLAIGTGGTLGTAAYTAATAYEAAGAIATHAALQTGVHGLAITAAKTLTVTESITFAGTDATVMTFPGASGTVATLNAANVFTNVLSVTDATDAASATSASLKTAGGIASVKGAWIGGTSRLVGNVQMDGTLGLGAAAVNYIAFNITKTTTGAGTSHYGIVNDFTGSASGTSNLIGQLLSIHTTAAAYTVITGTGLLVGGAALGAASAITNLYGIRVLDQTVGTTLNVGYESAVSSGTGKWNFYGSGTAQNAFAGNVRIGSVTAPTVALDVTGAALISTTMTVTGGFGCNTKAAQTAYASGGALAAYGAGANGFDTGANASALHAMVVSIRAALVANGIMS